MEVELALEDRPVASGHVEGDLEVADAKAQPACGGEGGVGVSWLSGWRAGVGEGNGGAEKVKVMGKVILFPV